VLALKEPDFGQVRVANELRKRVRTVWPRGVYCVWLDKTSKRSRPFVRDLA